MPGQDYPVYAEIPQGLSFRCDQRIPGYYSDPEAQCQVFRVKFVGKTWQNSLFRRFGIGACRAASSSASCARTARFSTSSPASATGGSMWTALQPRTCTTLTKTFTECRATISSNSISNLYLRTIVSKSLTFMFVERSLAIHSLFISYRVFFLNFRSL